MGMLKFHWVGAGRPSETTGGLWNSNGYDLIDCENVKKSSLEKTHGHIEPSCLNNFLYRLSWNRFIIKNI